MHNSSRHIDRAKPMVGTQVKNRRQASFREPEGKAMAKLHSEWYAHCNDAYPGYPTGAFSVHNNTQDPVDMGSIGAHSKS